MRKRNRMRDKRTNSFYQWPSQSMKIVPKSEAVLQLNITIDIWYKNILAFWTFSLKFVVGISSRDVGHSERLPPRSPRVHLAGEGRREEASQQQL
jgi:hypothetical protein